MSYIRPMKAIDLLNFERVNLNDEFVTTFGMGFYLEYLAKWPQYCHVMLSMDEVIEGYIIGKSEESQDRQMPTTTPYDPKTNKNMDYLPWHAHITALAIAPEARRQGYAEKLTEIFEVAANRENVWFVDLFVRGDNDKALKLYKKLGYTPFRKVVKYYQDGADAFDMRKPMKRDAGHLHIRPDGAKIEVDPSVVWDEEQCTGVAAYDPDTNIKRISIRELRLRTLGFNAESLTKSHNGKSPYDSLPGPIRQYFETLVSQSQTKICRSHINRAGTMLMAYDFGEFNLPQKGENIISVLSFLSKLPVTGLQANMDTGHESSEPPCFALESLWKEVLRYSGAVDVPHSLLRRASDYVSSMILASSGLLHWTKQALKEMHLSESIEDFLLKLMEAQSALQMLRLAKLCSKPETLDRWQGRATESSKATAIPLSLPDITISIPRQFFELFRSYGGDPSRSLALEADTENSPAGTTINMCLSRLCTPLAPINSSLSKRKCSQLLAQEDEKRRKVDDDSFAALCKAPIPYQRSQDMQAYVDSCVKPEAQNESNLLLVRSGQTHWKARDLVLHVYKINRLVDDYLATLRELSNLENEDNIEDEAAVKAETAGLFDNIEEDTIMVDVSNTSVQWDLCCREASELLSSAEISSDSPGSKLWELIQHESSSSGTTSLAVIGILLGTYMVVNNKQNQAEELQCRGSGFAEYLKLVDTIKSGGSQQQQDYDSGNSLMMSTSTSRLPPPDYQTTASFAEKAAGAHGWDDLLNHYQQHRLLLDMQFAQAVSRMSNLNFTSNVSNDQKKPGYQFPLNMRTPPSTARRAMAVSGYHQASFANRQGSAEVYNFDEPVTNEAAKSGKINSAQINHGRNGRLQSMASKFKGSLRKVSAPFKAKDV